MSTTAATTTVKAPAPASIPTGYYSAAAGKTGTQLEQTLHSIVSKGATDLGYQAARDALYGTVADPTNSNTVTDIYTGASISGVSSRASASSHDLNTEHLWPQSEGATGTAKDDLHVLRITNASVNSERSNLPFGVVKNVEWSSPHPAGSTELSVDGDDASGTKVFEPRASQRGNIARSLLYFYVRYGAAKQQPRRFTSTMFRKELPTLLEWNKQDPVDAAERARNDTVYALQGNRNPFIDNPKFIDEIGDHWLPSKT